MEVNYKIISTEKGFTALIQDIVVPNQNEKMNLIAKFDCVIPTGSRINRSIYKNCIIETFPDLFCTRNSQYIEIVVENSIIKKLDLKNLGKFKRLETFRLVNTTVEDLDDTGFQKLKDLTISIDKNPEDEEDKLIKIEANVNLKSLESDDVENGDQKANQPNHSIFGVDFSAPKSQKTAGNSFSFAYGTGSSSVFSSNTFGQPSLSGTVPKNVFGASPAKKSSDPDQKQQLKDRNIKLQNMNANLKKEVNVLQDQVMKLEIKNKKLSESGLLRDLKNVFSSDDFKDFSVNVCHGSLEQRFKVHKILLAARSSVFADEIRKSPDSTDMNLQNIPVTIFEKIVDFIYNDTTPEDDNELIGIYAAAGELNIVDLKNVTARNLMDKIDDKNAMKILKLSNKYDNEELKVKAFEKIKEILPEYKMSDKLLKTPEKIEKLLEIKKTLDMEFNKIQQEIEEENEAGSQEEETAQIVAEVEEIQIQGNNSDEFEVVE